MLLLVLKLITSALVLSLASGLFIFRPVDAFEHWPAEDPRRRTITRIFTAHRLPKYAAFGVIWLAGIVSVFMLPLCNNSPLRVGASILVIAGLWCEMAALMVFGTRASPTAMKTIVDNARYGITTGVGGVYLRRMSIPLAMFALAAIAFAMPASLPGTWGTVADHISMVTTTLAAVGSILIAWETKGGTTSFPPPYRLLACAASLCVTPSRSPPAPVDHDIPTSNRFRKILLIVDESVRGDQLSLNGHAVDTTPFLRSVSETIVNFGSATSASNSSVPSREVLRFCIPQQRLHEQWEVLTGSTSIWQFAQRAGFKTVHLDGFGTAELLSSGMEASERVHIDERYTFEQHDQSVRDHEIANALIEILHRDEKLFIFVEKVGTHVPYGRMYPATENVFEAERSLRFDLRNRDQFLKQYWNALRWSVDGFFATVLAKPLPHSTVIIYTSDHGQSLGERGTLTSHSSSDPSQVGELDVPLLVICSDKQELLRLSSASDAARRRQSHFSITPSLLEYLGYDAGYVRSQFGPSLADPPPDERLALFGGRIIAVGEQPN